jgi:hypothetical protein
MTSFQLSRYWTARCAGTSAQLAGYRQAEIAKSGALKRPLRRAPEKK